MSYTLSDVSPFYNISFNVKKTETIPPDEPAEVILTEKSKGDYSFVFKIPKGKDGVNSGYIYLGNWNANNTYPLRFKDCIVYVSHGEKLYENKINNNKGNNPNSTNKSWDLIFG